VAPVSMLAASVMIVINLMPVLLVKVKDHSVGSSISKVANIV